MARARQRNATDIVQIGVLVGDHIKIELDTRAETEGISLSHYCARILAAHVAEAA